MISLKLSFIVLVCYTELVICNNATTLMTEKSSIFAFQTSAVTATTTQTVTTTNSNTSTTLKSSTVANITKTSNESTETSEKKMKNSKVLQSNDLATSASGHRGATIRSVPGFSK